MLRRIFATLALPLFLSLLPGGKVLERAPFNHGDKEAVGNYYTDAATYYEEARGLSNNDLLFCLHEIMIETHRTYPSYDDSGKYQYQEFLDADLANPGRVLCWYSHASLPLEWNSGSLYNREHVWPQSLSSGLYGTSGAGSDMHHIRPTIVGINSDRGNKLYGEITGGSTSSYESGNLVSTYSGNVFEPHDQVKGDAARILMYMHTHYTSAQNLGIPGGGTESRTGSMPITNVVQASSTAAAWDLMLAWNELDPVDALEENRNFYAAQFQGNRNPFIDHPEFARMIWDPAYQGNGALNDDGGFEPTPVSGVILNKSNMNIDMGTSETLSATLIPSNATNKKVSWSSSDSQVATVENGVVRGIKEGNAVISVTTNDGGFRATCAVSVNHVEIVIPPMGESFEMDFYDPSMGTNNPINATLASMQSSFVDGNGNTYVSDYVPNNPGYVRYNANGGLSLGTGNNSGSFVLTTFTDYKIVKVEIYGVLWDNSSITVNSLTPTSGSLAPKGTPLANISNPCVYDLPTPTNSLTFATPTGRDKRATIYRLKLYPEAQDIPVSSIEFHHSDNHHVTWKETFSVSHTVLPAEASNKSLNWHSSDTSVATINNSGNVTTQKIGVVIISAQAVDGSGVSQSLTLHVNEDSDLLAIRVALMVEGEEICHAAYLPVRAMINALNDTDLEIFQNESFYAPAHTRFLAWASANGDNNPYSPAPSSMDSSHVSATNYLFVIPLVLLAVGLLIVIVRFRPRNLH